MPQQPLMRWNVPHLRCFESTYLLRAPLPNQMNTAERLAMIHAVSDVFCSCLKNYGPRVVELRWGLSRDDLVLEFTEYQTTGDVLWRLFWAPLCLVTGRSRWWMAWHLGHACAPQLLLDLALKVVQGGLASTVV